MYIRRVQIRNIRSIQKLEWELPAHMQTGWHVVIGDNGSGKSTFLCAIALALVGRSEAMALRQDWNDWLTRGELEGSIKLHFSDAPVELGLSRVNEHLVELEQRSGLERKMLPTGDQRTPNEQQELFSASYGPFRRFTGGEQEYRKIFRSNPRLAAHLSLFGEDVALTEYLSWLQDLQFKKLEERPGGDLLDHVRKFVNQEGFLPHQARLHKITSDGVEFIDGDGHQLPVESLSDGYRSILSMTFELIRQLAQFYSPDHVFDKGDPRKIVAPGVVLIDEVDAHLHPTWQRQVGLWFREHFPRIQFIVTTHSPLVCQAADVGTVYRLPRPGSDERPGMVTGIYLDRLVYGNVLDAYGTEVFGPGITRSEKAKERLRHLAELNLKELEKGLSDSEREAQEKLRAAMPTSAYTLSVSAEGER